jgi:hypothetical protein
MLACINQSARIRRRSGMHIVKLIAAHSGRSASHMD